MGTLSESLQQALALTVERALFHLPAVLGAVALLLAGWLLARLLRLVTRRSGGWIDALVKRATGHSRWRVGGTAAVLGTIVYWLVLLVFITAATQTLGLQTFTDWLARLLDHLPTLAAGLLIVGAGYLLSGFVADMVRAAASALAAQQRAALARLAQAATLVVALLVGADQMGLKVTWVAVLAAIITATLLGGLALAVSLGARGHVANLIGAHHLRQMIRPGQRLRVGAFEGALVDVSATSLVIETTEGRVVLPGSVFHSQAIELLHAASDPAPSTQADSDHIDSA